tara:strand:+ start:2176 stop:2466 length:291 start_codon:yes stop_codon:yes gene_type:complete
VSSYELHLVTVKKGDDMSLPSLAQGALEDKVQEIGEEIYMIVEENIDTFIDDTVHEALCSVDPEWGFDPVDFREDVMQSIKQYLSQTVRGVYNVQH